MPILIAELSVIKAAVHSQCTFIKHTLGMPVLQEKQSFVSSCGKATAKAHGGSRGCRSWGGGSLEAASLQVNAHTTYQLGHIGELNPWAAGGPADDKGYAEAPR